MGTRSQCVVRLTPGRPTEFVGTSVILHCSLTTNGNRKPLLHTKMMLPNTMSFILHKALITRLSCSFIPVVATDGVKRSVRINDAKCMMLLKYSLMALTLCIVSIQYLYDGLCFASIILETYFLR